ncbi:little elongation complex subunit 2 [Parambassis ranga]|uniref:Little elongation complex subunit 2 n=1 Tax=Parambassis ranga TaxID=210632 RepID=A0A6P7KBF3_9TELE|nr:little elongation complex subunit 2 [Parambassis ranga]
MELIWEDHPVSDAPFFTRDSYDKYSLSPNVRELWAFLQSPAENANIKQECDKEAVKASKDDDSDDACADNVAESTEDCKNTRKSSKRKQKQAGSNTDVPYPEPRLPVPCMSSLSSDEQRIYVSYLMNRNTREPPQNLKARVNDEVTQFMRYLQDVAKICADDYRFISHGAIQYSEDFLRSCLEYVETLPQLYLIHEMTSLTGGTFNPGLTLTFEKQLLTMGDVNITDHTIVPADAQLASDYHSVSSENPPAKKAKDMHATISNDGNAEKLSACYEPHVCLTRDALVRLLDNHGPDFVDQWELPVVVKLNLGKASSQKKTVYIDSPLLKTEMTVRERSLIYHEESLKLSIRKNGRKNVFHLMTELPGNEHQLSSENSQRSVVSQENNGLDFEVDLTDLETFGEVTPTKTSTMRKVQNDQEECDKSKKATRMTKGLSEHLSGTSSLLTCVKSTTAMSPVSEATEPNEEPMIQDSAQEIEEDTGLTGDSDDEKLVIDDSLSPVATPVEQCKPSSESSSPQKATKCKRQPKKAKPSGDQLSEILRLQTAMFKSSNDTAKCPSASDAAKSPFKSPTRSTGPLLHSHPTSLVKPCVSSFLERHQNEDGEGCAAPHDSSVVNMNTTDQKILSHSLQASAEIEEDYDAPGEGNLLYKLYSLQDLLLLVRSSVPLTHTRNVGCNQNQHVPVHVLPKLEYQLSYGVECLTSSEVCHLWTETLLHSSTVSYIAHINAHTSKVALLRKLPDDWKQNISCGFKLSKSLNILHHLLKKLTRLEEGQYLIAHKAGEPFVTLLKASDGKGSREAYNLHQVHSSVPQPPASGPLPWIPVDPAVVLPFHQKHNRVPCTFPPKPFIKMAKDGPSHAVNHGAVQKNNLNTKGQVKKSKQKKRAARRSKYIKKLIQQSV